MAATVRSADARVAGVPAAWGGLTRSTLPGGDPVGDVPNARLVTTVGLGHQRILADGGDQAGVGPGGRETLTHPVGRLLVGAVVQDERVRHAAVHAERLEVELLDRLAGDGFEGGPEVVPGARVEPQRRGELLDHLRASLEA